MGANKGPSVARGVMVHDELPDEVMFVAAQIGGYAADVCSYNVGLHELTCAVGDLAPGQSVEIVVSVQAKADETGVITNTAEIMSGDVMTDTVATTELIATANLTINKTASTSNPDTGEVFYYSISVGNSGPSTAQSVMVTDTLPMSVTFAYAEGAGCVADAGDPTGRTYVCSLGDIAPGGSKVVDIYVTLAPDVPDGMTLVNKAVATSSTPSQPVEDTASVVANTVADLMITKFGKPDGEIWAGKVITYTIVVNNLGPGVAHTVAVNDLIASDGSYILTVPAICGASEITPVVGNKSFSCSLPGNLPPGGSYEFQVYVTALDGKSINNVANVRGADDDPNLANNHADTQHQVNAVADVAVQKIASTGVVTAGATMSYTILVSNNGPSTAVGVELVDTLPAGVTVMSVTQIPAQGGCAVATPFKCQFGNLPAGDTVTVVIEVKVNPSLPEDAVLVNTASVVAQTYDSNTANNLSSVVTGVTKDIAVSIEKSSAKQFAVPGELVDFQIKVKNVGLSTIYNLWVQDDLPVGLTYVAHNVSPSGAASCADSQFDPELDCLIGQLKPGAEIRLIIRTRVDDSASGTLVNTVTTVEDLPDEVMAAAIDPIVTASSKLTATVTILTKTDLRVEKTSSTLGSRIGDLLVYNIKVVNNGAGVAVDTRVTDTLPAGVTYVSDSRNCGAGLSNCALGDLQPGASLMWQVAVRVNDSAVCNASLSNTALVMAKGGDTNPYDNTATTLTLVHCDADLMITKLAKPDGLVSIGQDLVYTLIVDNLGPNNAISVTVIDEMVSDGIFKIVSVTPGAAGGVSGGTCDVTPPVTVTGSKKVTCMRPSLAAGERWLIEMVVLSNEQMDINNVATVSSGVNDPNQANNMAMAMRSIGCSSDRVVDLVLYKSVFSPSNGKVVPGGTIVFNLDYANLSTDTDAACVTIVETVPNYTTFTSVASTPGWTCPNGSPMGTVCALKLGTLPAGAKGTVQFAVIVDEVLNGVDTIENRASITSGNPELVPGSNESQANLSIEAPTGEQQIEEPNSKRIYLPLIAR